MVRAPTGAQVIRRQAILERLLGAAAPMSVQEIRSYLVGRVRIFVTEDTIQRDLRLMEREGSLLCEKRSIEGYVRGCGRLISYNGWTAVR